MKRTAAIVAFVMLVGSGQVGAYIEVPYSLGRLVQEASHVALVEVQQVSQEKKLIIYKKLRDIKGKHPDQQIKHNIGTRGFHPREWQTVMAWAQPGKKAVFFHNGGASETCIGSYWYQCYREGEWWGMSHAEPYLLRTYCGDAEKLADAVAAMLQGKEVAISCMADGNVKQLHERKGKLQIVKASLKRLDYNPKRDFVAFGGDAVDIPEFRTVLLLSATSSGWKYAPAAKVPLAGNRWAAFDFDDAAWQAGKTPIGYGEAELAKRGGTQLTVKGQPFLFRREFNVPSEALQQAGTIIRLSVASDDSAAVYLNGTLVDQDPVPDHEYVYWNREVDLKPQQLKVGRNVVAALVKNGASSSDLYFDLEIAAEVPLPKRVPGKTLARQAPFKALPLPAEKLPPELVIDPKARTVTVPCTIAPRKLPHLKEVYPIEVVATQPHPQGQKAHETIINFQGIRPSMVHQALLQLGLKPGRPALGQGEKPSGPELTVLLELPDAGGKTKRWPIDQLLVDTRTGKQPPAFTWHFTGSNFRQPDPLKDEHVYGANLSGTLITIYPVTDETVLQAGLTAEAESAWRLETNTKVLPKEGTNARLVIQVR